MAFLTIKIIFAEDDFEQKENLGLEVHHSQGNMTINTCMIVGYNEMDNGNTLVRMANGDAYETAMGVDTFENRLKEVDLIIRFSEINEN